MNLNGKEYFYIRNVQNDVIGLHDTEGKVVVSYSYDTWGNIVSITGSLKDSVGKKNPYRYRGYRYDEETGLYYLQSRYYNGSWGRFINADALIGQPGDILSFNMFAYCGNNPVIMEDPNGYRFDITGGRDNGKYISMAIQSQYPAIKKNVERKQVKEKRENGTKSTIISAIDSAGQKGTKYLASPTYIDKCIIHGEQYTQELPKVVYPGAKTLDKVSKKVGLATVVTSTFSIVKNLRNKNYEGVACNLLGIGAAILIGGIGLTGASGFVAGIALGMIADGIIEGVVSYVSDEIRKKKWADEARRARYK